MPYVPSLVVAGDKVNANVIDENISSFREEVTDQNRLIRNDDVVSSTLTTAHIAPPSLTAPSLRQFEWRGESGGIKVITKPSANFEAMEDAALYAPTGTYPDREQQSSPGTRPANSAISRVIHQDDETSATFATTGKPFLPGLALTVRFDHPSEVMIRAKFIQNFLPGQATGTVPLLSLERAADQYFNLVIVNADGTEESATHTSRRAYRTQHHNCLREIYITQQIRITTPGEYHFGIRGTLRPTPNDQAYPSGSRSKYETPIALCGKSEFQVEWYHQGQTKLLFNGDPTMIASIQPVMDLFLFLCFNSIPNMGLAPLVVGAIIMAASAVASAGTQAAIASIPTKTEKELKAQKDALGKELVTTPGLTEAEQMEFASLGQSTVAGAEREMYARATELAALEGLQGADLVALQRDIAAQTTAQRADIAEQVRQLELAKQAQNEEEYRNLQAAVLNSELARKGGQIQATQQIGQAGTDFATMATLYETKYGQGGGAIPESVG